MEYKLKESLDQPYTSPTDNYCYFLGFVFLYFSCFLVNYYPLEPFLFSMANQDAQELEYIQSVISLKKKQVEYLQRHKERFQKAGKKEYLYNKKT
jgi:hypothetical protein